MKLFEALQSGAVVIASDTPANREVVDEDDVVFFKPDDAKDLADKIEKVNRDPVDEKLIQRTLLLARKYGFDTRAHTILEALRK